jgi:hypothetical protein
MADSFRYRNKSNMDIFEIFPYGIQFFLLQQIITLNNLYISAVFECFVMKRSNKEEIIVQSKVTMSHMYGCTKIKGITQQSQKDRQEDGLTER